jgi:hypothetical protein
LARTALEEPPLSLRVVRGDARLAAELAALEVVTREGISPERSARRGERGRARGR